MDRRPIMGRYYGAIGNSGSDRLQNEASLYRELAVENHDLPETVDSAYNFLPSLAIDTDQSRHQALPEPNSPQSSSHLTPKSFNACRCCDRIVITLSRCMIDYYFNITKLFQSDYLTVFPDMVKFKLTNQMKHRHL